MSAYIYRVGPRTKAIWAAIPGKGIEKVAVLLYAYKPWLCDDASNERIEARLKGAISRSWKDECLPEYGVIPTGPKDTPRTGDRIVRLWHGTTIDEPFISDYSKQWQETVGYLGSELAPFVGDSRRCWNVCEDTDEGRETVQNLKIEDCSRHGHIWITGQVLKSDGWHNYRHCEICEREEVEPEPAPKPEPKKPAAYTLVDWLEETA